MPELNSRMAQLRAATQDAHARVEAAPALARLMAPDIMRYEYIAILQHMHALYSHLEPVVAVELETRPDAAAMLDGSRPRRLADDLAWFGAPTILPPPLPELNGPEAALGALYVIEGSGLGGRVIGRHLAENLGVKAGAGGSFFCGLDAETARLRWSRLGAVLASPAIGNASAADSIAGAVKAFEFFERCFRGIDPGAGGGRTMAEAVTP